ncbi:lytic transglycosylase domain-containing protein [Catellatospora tritici]|uniref:lytic transglycosylase domain-containing protein n=1 Tax=Catellatospora tritici TaxID=2851566 RepID=UPI001C2CF493|nr:lytic transglycosylase domain-containing protein [Catellatospora tritici]MBV1852358.1 lytic transglycosylase domain-containing protein [Catellatospora tritici]
MRVTRVHYVFGALAVVGVLIAGTAIVLDGGDPPRTTEPPAAAAAVEGSPVEPSLTPEASPSPSASPSAKPKPSKSPTRKPQPKPSPRPTKPAGPAAPPPAPAPLPSGKACPFYEGTNAPKAEVEAALEAAAARRYWTKSAVTLPTSLIKAVAKQESGWQSAIVACDGGVGTMQVMPVTADWLNNASQFTMDEDLHKLSGNTMLGSAYLQWLIKYFGDRYDFGTCDVDTEPDPSASPSAAPAPCPVDYTLRESDCARDPAVPDSKEWCLLNAVISAYNYGQGAVDREATDGDTVFYPNPQYVGNVRALMGEFSG